jgi:prophage regulatory protein
MPEIKLERLPVVLAKRSDGRSSLYADIQRGTWTPPVRMGRAAAWPAHETQELLAARVAGATDDELRELVRDLLAQRTAGRPRAA